MLSVIVATILSGPGTLPMPPQLDDPQARVSIDSSRREVAVTVGPFDIAALPEGVSHAEMEMDKDKGHNTPVFRFEWPIDGWFRGFRYEMRDKDGKAVEPRVMHHMIMVNFDRRQLLYNAVERLMGAGQETGSATIPRTIGVPLTPGQHLGMYLAWSNETGVDLEGVEFTVYLEYSPSNLNPRPVNALPLYMDVNLTVGGGNGFDMLPGRTEKSWEFSPPINGRLLGVGGHLHDYGVSVRLEEVDGSKVLTQIDAEKSPDGKLLKLGRKLFGVSGRGLKLEKGKRYRVVGMYDNPTGETIPGAMAHMVGLFVPDNLSEWPKIDLANETLQMDLAKLQEMGGGHEHGADEKTDHKMPMGKPGGQ